MSDLREHRAVARVAAELRAAGLDGAADGMRVLDDEVRTAAKAAEVLGVAQGAIVNSLVFRLDDDAPLLVLMSGAHRADPAALARVAGVGEVHRADPEFVRAHAGQAIGGVAPVGHPERLRTIVDPALGRHGTVWAAAGHAKVVFPSTFDELVVLTGGEPVDVAA